MRHTSRRSAVSVGVLVAVLGAVSVIATGRQAPGATAPQQPTFRVSVDLVTLDVIPRTANGQFVPNLTKDDFQVLEDGTAQEIASLVMVHGGRVFNILQPPAAPAAALPRASSCRAPGPPPTPPDASSCWSSTTCISRRSRRHWSASC